MDIVYFHRKWVDGAISIQENFRPLIEEISKEHTVQVLSVPYYAGSNPVKMLKNILYIRKHSTKTGINHITGDIHYGILGLIGRKSVLTIHDDYAIRQTRRGGVFNKLYKWLFWYYFPLKIANAPICTTPTTLKNISRLYNSKKLKVITHHCLPPVFKDKGKPINKNCPHLMHMGTENNKNLETTLKVVSRLNNYSLTVIKPMKEHQHDLAKELHVNYENKFNLPFDEIVAEYDKCDIVLFPSLFEGLGMPIIEGQASGKPVITSDLEAMNWTAGDSACLLKNPLDEEEYYDALLKVINDDEYRNELIQKGFENIKRFSLEKAVKSYTELYESLLS